ncbi:MAG TPA: LuxR C-terminal-related transcriptional regulator [Gaiellaceae bacterium]|jgi:DNA-binding CsgD family transcriptional regulator/tetratricopeptide (TPR) repeat protein|nr:LuxR C-terminal-related transcriptional regulator [Gaiellaceae bacterium]
MNTTADLERGHAAYSSSAWQDAYASLSEADRTVPLAAEDLELLATSAYMLGREDDCVQILGRAVQRYSDDGVLLRAARCAFWIGMQLALRGEMGPATGWLGRAQRLVDREDRECAEQGYMLLPVAFEHEVAGDFEGAATTAGAAAELGERFGDADLFALAVHVQGGTLVKCGRVGEGLALLDEAMVAAIAGELSPIVTGTVYCGVILACEEIYELRRAQEWTAVLARWCEQQPDLVAFTGRCLVHRAQLMQLHGDWRDALEEAHRAGERFELSMNEAAAAKACYLRGEVHRLRGEFAEAEESYREASQLGLEPQPGWALLRLAQGNADAAAAAIRRAIGETTDRLKRAGLLPAYAEILIAVGDLDDARLACAELGEIAAECESAMLEAIHGHARGAVELAAGDASNALVSLRRAAQAWKELEAPYEAARARVLVGQACRELGDEDAFSLELEAARGVFEQLGAAPDLTWVDALMGKAATTDAHGLSPRELEVLRLVASGKSNREIAGLLVISEHTVARHVQNIFTKLGVPSRTAAGAFAFEHDLV